MDKAKTLEKVKNTTSYDARALVAIDLGNGQPKAIIDMPGIAYV